MNELLKSYFKAQGIYNQPGSYDVDITIVSCSSEYVSVIIRHGTWDDHQKEEDFKITPWEMMAHINEKLEEQDER